MNKWFTTPATTPRFEYPETLFVRWVADHYYRAEFRSDIKFLELGSGSGGDLKFLQQQGFDAEGIDSHPLAYATLYGDISTIEIFKEEFDCIYDLNVLCCIKDPPYKAISDALKPCGKFFSITPATGTMADFTHLEYVRKSTPFSIRTALNGIFSKIEIEFYQYPHRRRSHMNWVIEADK